MSPRDFAFVGCRLLALFFLVEVITTLPYTLSSLASAFASWELQDTTIFYHASRWLMLASPIVSLSMVLVLWFGAGWLAGEVADGAPAGTSGWSPSILLSVGVALLGLSIVAFALPTLALYLVYLADGAAESRSLDSVNFVPLVVRCAIGIGLILGAQRIAAFITTLRRL
jgi:hypothetical protein